MEGSSVISFSWLLGDRTLGLTEVFPSAQATFSVVQINELEAPGSFIQPDSFVLTVGAAFRGREPDLAGYVAHLAQQGAVAVGFGISSVFGEIPQTVIDSAREHGVGLYEVSRPVPFARILSAVHEEQNRRLIATEQQRARAQHKLLSAQEKLTRTAISGDLAALTADVAEVLEAHVLIKDPALRLLERSTAHGFDPKKQTYFSSYKISTAAHRPYMVEVTSTRVITDEARSLIRHYAGLAATLLARPAQLRRVHNQLNSFALRIQLGLGDETELFSETVNKPTDSDGFTRPVVIAAQSQRALRTVLTALDHAAAERDELLHTLHVAEAKLLLVVHPDVTLRNVLNDLGEHRKRVRVASGSPVLLTRLSPEHVSHLVARTRTLAPGDATSTSDSALPWLREPAVNRALSARRTEIFGRLNSYDAAHGTDYEKTLAIYLRHGGHIAHSADALGAHRHTVRTRIEKIQKLCEINLDNPAHFSEAFLAMTADDESLS